MRWVRKKIGLPTFEPNRQGVADAEQAVAKSNQDYAIALTRSTALHIQAARVRNIRERNGFGPAIEYAVGRPR